MHNKNEKTKPKVSSIKRKQKKQNQKVVLENEKGKSKPEVSFSFNHPKKFFETVKKRKKNEKKQMEKFFEKITFSKNAGLLCIEASKNGGINDSAIFSISR